MMIEDALWIEAERTGDIKPILEQFFQSVGERLLEECSRDEPKFNADDLWNAVHAKEDIDGNHD